SRLHLFVATDAGQVVFENGNESNNAAQPDHTVDVMPIPYANLTVSSVVADANAVSGGKLHLSCSVQNQGIGITSTNNWFDSVQLVSDSGAVVATYSFSHLGDLAQNGGTYSRAVDLTVPNGISGQYRVQVTTGGPYEFIYTNDNTATSAPVTIALAPSPDLVVTDIQVPVNATEGDYIDVSWTVTNQGAATARGVWTDQVSLQPIGQPGASNLSVGHFRFDGSLDPGKSYSRTERFLLPARTEGLYRAFVLTNADLPEVEHRDF